jgi:AsmA-like C-terminal region
MPTAIVEHPVEKAEKPQLAVWRWHWWHLPPGLLIAAFIGYLIFIALNWPFKEQSVINVLQEASLRTVKIGSFHKTFFPPGCVAEQVQFQHHIRKDKPPIIYIQTLTVHGSYWGLLTGQYRLALVKVVHMHVTVPPPLVNGKPDPIMPLNHTDNSVKTLRIDKIVADGAVLDFMHQDGGQPYKLTIEKLAMFDVSNNSTIHYKTILWNELPPGKIRSAGVFGPWNPTDPAATPLSGTYTYQDANLGVFKELSGTMQAQGTFSGKLGEIQTKGTVDVAKFHVADTSHFRELKAAFQARVDGKNGDTTLDDVRAQFDHSALLVKGAVAGQEGRKGKTISLDLICGSGRIEDILDLFIEARRAPMTGALQMKAHVDVPPGKSGFLTRLRMSGDFGVENSKFTDKETQSDLNRLSESAEKKKDAAEGDELALSNLKGHGEIRNGVATLSQLHFNVPGATAVMSGTYSLINYDVNLHGELFTDGKPWQATTGFKSWVLRAITPFLKKKQNMRVVPFRITGNYSKTNVGLDLGSKNK